MENIEQLLKAYGQGRRPEQTDPGPSCLSDEQIAAMAEGKYRGKQLRQVLKHLAQCSYCRQEVVELKETMRTLESVEVPQHIFEAEKAALATIAAPKVSFEQLKQDFKAVAHQFAWQFLTAYYQVEEAVLEAYWKMIEPMVQEGMRLTKPDLAMSTLSMVGEDIGEEENLPDVILAVLATCAELQERQAMDRKTIQELLKKNANTVDLPRETTDALQHYLLSRFQLEDEPFSN